MCRRARHLFALCSAVSLLLFVAACVLWMRSYRTMDNFGRYAVDPATPSTFAEARGVGTARGAFTFGHVRVSDPSQLGWTPPPRGTSWRWMSDPVSSSGLYPRTWSWLGFARWDQPLNKNNGGGFARGFQVPLWAIALLSAVAPALWLARAHLRSRQTRRRQAGLCPGCGYDLRASPERCPECGCGH
jgi:hypothetical protein